MKLRACAALCSLLCWLHSPGWAQHQVHEQVQVPSLDATGGAAVQLPGFWFPAPGDAGSSPAPALVLLHGCGGPYDGLGQQRRLSLRMREHAQRWHALGVAVLVVDSLTPRGETELCTQAYGRRQVTMVQRRRDALGALQWLAAQPGVDRQRLGLLGWSHGGSTVLAALNAHHPEVAAAAVQPSLAVAFYPGCETERRRPFQATAPMLLLLGAEDDWTPAAPCEALAAQITGHTAQLESYAGAYHGFDGTAPLRLRRDVPNGTHPGLGVHVGGHAEARALALARLTGFLRERWALPAAASPAVAPPAKPQRALIKPPPDNATPPPAAGGQSAPSR